MKKQFKSITIVLSLMFFVLGISSVFSSWTYYEGPVESTSVEISNIELGEFIYDYSDVHPGFEHDSGGYNGSSVLDKIIDDNTGINDNEGEFNQILQHKLPSSGFVTSIDTVNLTNYDVDKIKEILGIDENSHYLIQKVNDYGSQQLWYVYITDFPVENIKILEKIDENGDTIRYYNTEYIYDVYRSEVIWYNRGFGEGEYIYDEIHLGKTIKGYADPIINSENNNTDPFFSPSTWHEGSYIKLKDIELTGPSSIYIDEVAHINANLIPANATKQKIIWSIDNPSVAIIDQNGIVTPKQEGNVVVSVKSSDHNFKARKFNLEIKVRNKDVLPSSVEIIHNNIANNIVMGQQIQLDTKVLPNDTYNKNVKWTTNDSSIATIDENGLLTVKNGIGQKEIIVTASSIINPNISSSVKFKVNPAQGDKEINGEYKTNDKDRTLREYKAKNVDVGTTDYLFTDSFTSKQAIKFTIPQSNPAKKIKLSFSSEDKNVQIVQLHYVINDNVLKSYMFDPQQKEIILDGYIYTDITYFVTFKSSTTTKFSVKII